MADLTITPLNVKTTKTVRLQSQLNELFRRLAIQENFEADFRQHVSRLKNLDAFERQHLINSNW